MSMLFGIIVVIGAGIFVAFVALLGGAATRLKISGCLAVSAEVELVLDAHLLAWVFAKSPYEKEMPFGTGIFIAERGRLCSLDMKRLPKLLLIGRKSVSRKTLRRYSTVVFVRDDPRIEDRLRRLDDRLMAIHLARTSRPQESTSVSGADRSGYIITGF